MVRFKNRYFLCKVTLKNNEIVDGISTYSLSNVIKQTVEQLFGDWGIGCTPSLQVKYYSPYTGLAIIRVSKDFYKYLWASIFFTTTLKNRQCQIKVIHLSGTIKQAQKNAILYNKKVLQSLVQLSAKKRQKLEEDSEELLNQMIE